MLRFFFAFYLLMGVLFPIPAIAWAPFNDTITVTTSTEKELVKLGDFISRQVLACFKKEDLDYVTDPKTANTRQAYVLFTYPYRCGVQVVEIILLRYERKFVAADGTPYWQVGVGREDGKVLFYIALPEADLK